MNYYLVNKIDFIIKNFDELHYFIIHIFFIKKAVLNQLLVKMKKMHLMCENESEIVVFGVFTRRDFFVLFVFQFLRQLDDFCIHT